MIDYNSLYDGIYDIVSPLTSPLPLIRDTQSNLKPSEKYTTFRIVKLKKIGFLQTYASLTDGTVDLHQTYALTLRLRIIGADSSQDAAKLHMKLQRQSIKDSFESINLFYYDCTDLRDVPRLVTTGYEDQSIFDLEFYMRIPDQDSPGWIEFVEFEQTIKNANSVTIIQHTDLIDLAP